MVSPAAILLPLYIYPSIGAWNFLTQSIAANPSLQFNVIVNPDSGPGNTPLPDSSYIAGITSLKKHTNVKLLGYVHTSYAARPLAEIERNISIYAGWKNYKASDIRVSGIFFDEVSSTSSKTVLSYMSTLSAFTKKTLGTDRGCVAFNPGVQVDKAFYNYADMIVVWEDAFSAAGLTAAIAATPKALRKKSSFIIHDFKGTALSQTSVVGSLFCFILNLLFLPFLTYYVPLSPKSLG